MSEGLGARPPQGAHGGAPRSAGATRAGAPRLRWDTRDLRWDEEQRAADERMQYEYGQRADGDRE